MKIKSRYTGSVIYEAEAESIKQLVEMAVASGANLAGANLAGANLGGATLRKANLAGATLYRANLAGADLYRATLYRANLGEATLREANLREVTLDRANIYGATIREVTLDRANIYGAIYGEGVPMSKVPVQVLGLRWPVYVFDSHIKIGCQIHTTGEWAAFDDRRIAEMDGRRALEFLNKYKTMILAVAEAHQK